MRRIIFKVVLPLILIELWMLMWYPICRTEEGFNLFLYWILVGFPFGIRKMCMMLIPKNFGIAGGMGVLALNVIMGGLLGGTIVTWKIVEIIVFMVKFLI